MKARPVHQVWVDQPNAIQACACLQPVANGYWLTSLFVTPARRHQGLAGQLLDSMRAATQGPIWLFCRTELVSLYLRHGYTLTTILPESLTDRLARYRRNRDLVALVHPG